MDIKMLDKRNVMIVFSVFWALGSALWFSPVSAMAHVHAGDNPEYNQQVVSSLIAPWSPNSVDMKKCPDFRYPSHKPSIVSGEKVYKSNCSSCHGSPVNKSSEWVQKLRQSTIAQQFEVVCNGGKDHEFRFDLSVDERWDSLIYMRAQTLGYFAEGTDEYAAISSTFGGNCAVCHGTRGQGDGNLYKSLYPPPANFQMFERLYNRSDANLHHKVTHGIPWTAMPAWKKRYDFDKDQNFSPEMIWKLIRYVRQFSFAQDIDRLDKGRQNLEDYKKEIGESN